MKVLVVRGKDAAPNLIAQLARRGFQVAGADSGTTAMEMLRRVRIDAVIADHRLEGGRSGIWLLEQVRQLSPQMPRILFAADDRIDPDRLVERGVCDYVFRPSVEMRRLQIVLRSFLTSSTGTMATGVPATIIADHTPAMGF